MWIQSRFASKDSFTYEKDGETFINEIHWLLYHICCSTVTHMSFIAQPGTLKCSLRGMHLKYWESFKRKNLIIHFYEGFIEDSKVFFLIVLMRRWFFLSIRKQMELRIAWLTLGFFDKWIDLVWRTFRILTECTCGFFQLGFTWIRSFLFFLEILVSCLTCFA